MNDKLADNDAHDKILGAGRLVHQEQKNEP